MPIPKPKKNETEEEFIPRCMSDGVMRKEFPKRDQRFAVCMNKWKEHKNDKKE